MSIQNDHSGFMGYGILIAYEQLCLQSSSLNLEKPFLWEPPVDSVSAPE